MTIEHDCDHGDYSGGENLIAQFDITTKKGMSLETLKTVELAKVTSLLSSHEWDHPGHTAKVRFSIPKGYVSRHGVVYKARIK